ncbi:MAG: EscU/YscU/HrcU family type III secretion system export apparatus switch protein [Actinomycetota bacterium]
MADKPAGQRTEKPTAKRLREARKRGQIPRSPDLVGWVALLLASFVLPPVLGGFRSRFTDYFLELNQALGVGRFDLVMAKAGGLIFGLGVVFVPFLFLLMVITAGGLAVQGGVTITAEPLRPKWERISPKAGLKRLFSLQSAVDTGKAVFRLVAIVVLVTQIMTTQIAAYLAGTGRNLEVIGEEVGASLLFLLRLAATVGVVVGVADYAYQRHKVGKQLKMTKDEVRRENKNTEGDPFIRSRRKAMHAKVSQNQMLAAVGDASVVVVNPTHVAVALAYEAGGVPTVVAKGGDAVAARIRERAFEEGVPVVEVRPLARLLHDLIEVGDEVPAFLYEAVAIVIAFVMRAPSHSVGSTIRKLAIPASKLLDRGGD